MAAPNILDNRLDIARRRIRLLLTVRYGLRAVSIGLGISILWYALARLRVAPNPHAMTLGIIVGIAGLAGIVMGLVCKLSDFDAARLVEDRTGMKERFSSAVEFSHTDASSPIIERQQQDAAKAFSQRVMYRSWKPFRAQSLAKRIAESLSA
ncbi:MAG: hypothetical protein ABJA67_08675, partial [Chthonomonadales bacterium]